MSQTHRLHLHDCPSHNGIVENERAVQNAFRNLPPPQPEPLSITAARSLAREAAMLEWDHLVLGAGPKYWGRRYTNAPGFRKCTHTGAYPLKAVGHSSSFSARLIRALTGHAPIGYYRLRFFPDQPTNCECNLPELQTVRHAFDRCTRYKSPYRLRFDRFLDALDPFPLITDWLERFPSAFTFEDAPPTS